MTPIKLDSGGENVKSSAHADKRQFKLTFVLKKHEHKLMLSVDASQNPAYKVVCDIDVMSMILFINGLDACLSDT